MRSEVDKIPLAESAYRRSFAIGTFNQVSRIVAGFRMSSFPNSELGRRTLVVRASRTPKE